MPIHPCPAHPHTPTHHLLLRQVAAELGAGDERLALQGGHRGKGPAGAAAALVLDGGHLAQGAPVPLGGHRLLQLAARLGGGGGLHLGGAGGSLGGEHIAVGGAHQAGGLKLLPAQVCGVGQALEELGGRAGVVGNHVVHGGVEGGKGSGLLGRRRVRLGVLRTPLGKQLLAVLRGWVGRGRGNRLSGGIKGRHRQGRRAGHLGVWLPGGRRQRRRRCTCPAKLTICCSCFTDACASAALAKLRSLGRPPARAAEATTMVERRSTRMSFMVGRRVRSSAGEQRDGMVVQRRLGPAKCAANWLRHPSGRTAGAGTSWRPPAVSQRSVTAGFARSARRAGLHSTATLCSQLAFLDAQNSQQDG